ncbi:hypothetical protein [Aestuariivivens insulae]|uniref:hypothetical protein n=1 Tax=Aestuariivivens insulae TaxID=1621988 RepID=UPI001F57D927|nr:hypothetical protein [Aestuariivivens insulae]
MRTNNGNIRNIIISVYFILIVAAIIMSTVFSVFQKLIGSPKHTFFVLLFGFIGLFLLVHWISRYFEYDSDGMKVIVINKGLLLSDYLNYRESKVEFEKKDLISYKLYNYLVYKSLILYIRSRKGGSKRVSFNVTLVDRRKLKYIRQSLRKMIKANQK